MSAAEGDASGPESSRTFDRGLELLELLATRPEGWTVTELAAALGFGRASVYRLLGPLEARGYTSRAGDGRVRLGLAVLRLAGAAQPAVLDAALPVLRQLAEEVGATAHLVMREGAEAVAIAVVEPSWTDVHVAYRVGTRHPIGVAAAGHALAALHEDAPRPWYTSSGELQAGAHGVAAPVPGTAPVELSVGVLSLSPLDASEIGPQVVLAAAAVAEAIR